MSDDEDDGPDDCLVCGKKFWTLCRPSEKSCNGCGDYCDEYCSAACAKKKHSCRWGYQSRAGY